MTKAKRRTPALPYRGTTFASRHVIRLGVNVWWKSRASMSSPRGRAEPGVLLVEQRGIEHPATGASNVGDRRVDDPDQATQDDERRREVSASEDVVEAALARAIERATAAGRWDVVAQLAKELEARRLHQTGKVVHLTKRAARGGTG
jgi:hypothetical protein